MTIEADRGVGGSLLIVVGGRPGVGKSAVATAVARLLAPHLISVDGVADRLIDVWGFASTTPQTVYAQVRADVVAARRKYHRIIVDGMNPDASTRRQWREIGMRRFDRFVDVEIRCTDPEIWAKRMERRASPLIHIAAPDWLASRSCLYEDRTDDRSVFDSATSDVATIAREIACHCRIQCPRHLVHRPAHHGR